MKVPVLIIAFNRLDTVTKVFETVRKYKPSSLFLFADGNRQNKEGEAEKCQAVRDWLVKSVDWECDVNTFFPEENFGCGRGPSSAINWFFENVDSGIILEDDCVPHSDFFEYAEVMLEKYKNDSSVMAVNSSNFQPVKRGDGSYYFSMQNGPFCAWATWKRAWKNFDLQLQGYSYTLLEKAIKAYGVTKRECKWWLDIFDYLQSSENDGSSWDYQFIFAIWMNNGKSVVPNSNLSTNIGFGLDATHTTNHNDVTANRPIQGILPLTYPSSDKICREADLYYHDFYYDKFVDHTPWYIKLKRNIKQIIGIK